MDNFWETKTLAQMNHEEWEALCDACGLCCLVKIEDEDSAEVFNTTISCRHLNVEICRCDNYQNRIADVPMCTKLTLDNLPLLKWLPNSCAYKRLYEGNTLAEWHPLITKDNDSVHNAGISAKWFALSEEYVHPEQWVEFIIIPDEK